MHLDAAIYQPCPIAFEALLPDVGGMTNKETGVALMIPELHTKAELVTVSIRGAAHDHLPL